MNEVILIRGKLVGIGERPTPECNPQGFQINYAFYDKHTGEVWGHRTIQGLVSDWIYLPGETGYPDLLLPFEATEAKYPVGVIAYICDYLLEQFIKEEDHVNTSK